MKYQETAAEIERETEIFNKARKIYRFIILCLYYRVNPCKKMIVMIVNLLWIIEKKFYQIIAIKLQKN